MVNNKLRWESWLSAGLQNQMQDASSHVGSSPTRSSILKEAVMIKVNKIKTETGFVYEAIAVTRGVTVRHPKRKKALKKLARKLYIIDFKNKIKKIVKKFLHIK